VRVDGQSGRCMGGVGSAMCFQDLGEARRYAAAVSGSEEEI